MKTLILFLLMPAAIFAQTFSPAPGTYSSVQNVAITCPSGKTAFYRTDGLQPVTIASTKYTAPIPVNSTQTIAAICATLGAYQTNLPAGGPAATCSTALGGTFPSGLNCDVSGGVGTVNPSNATWTFGPTSTETVTAPASTSSEVQILYKWLYGGNADPSAPTCDLCTEQVQDIVIEPTVGNSVIANNEMDMPQYDFTHSVNRQNGLQCNQQSGKLRWEVDSGQAGGWTGTGVACNLAANTTYEVVDSVSHILGDTGCGGNGCAHYNYLWVNGVQNTLGGTYGNTQGYSSQSGQKAWGRQDQIDLKPTTTTPITGGRKILSATVALGFGDESSVISGAYTITGSTGATPCSYSPPAGTYGTSQSVTLSSTGKMFYTTDGSTPTVASTQYTGPIAVTGNTTIKCIAAVLGFQQLNAQNNNPSGGGTYWKNADCASFAAWSSATAYSAGATVSSAGFNWVATAASTNQTPASNPSVWSKYSSCAADDPGGTGVSTVNPTHTSGNSVPSLSGASMFFSQTGQPSHQTNVLWPLSSSFGSCNNCTYFLEDHYYYWGSSNSSSNEDDMYQFNSTSQIRYMAGLQYCYGSGCPGGATGWDYGGNSNVPWTPTGVSDGGTLNTWHHFQRVIHRVPAEETSKPCTSSGTWPFIYFDLLAIDGNIHTNGGGAWTFCANALPTGWSASAGMQSQIDIASHATALSSSVNWDYANFYALYTPSASTTAVYTISGGFTPPVKLNGTITVKGQAVLQ